MRSDSANFNIVNVSTHKEPRYVIEVSFNKANTDLYYFTSHADASLPGGALSVDGVVENISGTSQSITPEKALATIGNIDFDVVDYNGAVTTLQFDKLSLGKGLRGQRVRVYKGYKGFAWSDYSLIQTQIIEDVSFRDGSYSFKCDDIQRETRKDIFDSAKSNLTQSVGVSDSTINITSTANFEPLKHGNSYSDAPNQTVYYIKIEDEIIRATGKTASSFTGCTRGVLNTKAAKHYVDLTASSDRRTSVTEYVYLELPIPKLIYALLTGKLIGQAEVLPTSWHLGIDESFVRLSDFTGYGEDIFDTSNDNAGVVVRFDGLKKQDGKNFIEKELHAVMGGFSPVYSDGAIGLKPMARVLSQSGFVYQLDEDNIISHSDIKYDMSSIHNHIEIQWNWSSTKEKFTRRNILIDSDSIAINGLSNPLRFKFKGLFGNRHSAETLGERFNAFRDRYSSPPMRLTVKCLLLTNVLEVGDIVRVNLPNVKDYYTGEPLARSFEVQHVSINWLDGTVSLRLFASARAAGELASTTATSVISDEWYSSEGKNLATYVGGGYNAATDYQEISGVGHIKSSCFLAGGANLRDASTSIYYHIGDLVIDAGVILSRSNNVQLRVMGHLTINGDINGVGAGNAGGVDLKSLNQFSPYTTQGAYTSDLYSHSYNAGIAGFLGPTVSMGGERYDNSVSPSGGSIDKGHIKAVAGNRVNGQYTTVPNLTLNFANGVLNGIPSDMRGTSGSSGGNVAIKYGSWVYSGWSVWMGGAGGAGGAGLFVVSRGASFGVSGGIDSSGADGEIGTHHGSATYSETYGNSGSTTINTPNNAGGGAGGAPGAVYFAIDGASQTYPNLSSVVSRYGNTPISGTTRVPAPSVFLRTFPYTGFAENWYPYYLGVGAANADLSGYKGGSRVSFVIGAEAPEQDADADILAPPTSPVLASGDNALFVAQDGSVVERIKAIWSAPGDARVAGYEVQYKKSSNSVWTNLADVIGETETYAWPVNSGENYDVRIRSADGLRNTSNWLTTLNHTVIGKIEPPPKVTGFIVSQNDEGAVLKWDSSGIKDSAGFIFRYAEQSIADYSSAKELTTSAKGTQLTSKAIPPGIYRFFAKEVDNGGRESEVAAYYDATISTSYDVIYNNEEHPLWPGHIKGFSVQNNALIPGATNEAVYTTDEYDLGFNDVVRVWASISASLSNVTSKIDRGLLSDPVTEVVDRGLLSEAVTKTVDNGELGYGVSGESANVVYEVATRKEGEYHTGADEIIDRGLLSDPVTQIVDRGLLSEAVTETVDNGGLVKFQPWTIGDIEFRHIIHRVRCLPNETGALPALLKFTPTLDLYEREEEHTGLSIAAGGSRFNFNKPFHLTPKVTPKVMSGSPLFAIPTSIDETGFNINGWDTSGANVGIPANEFGYNVKGV